MGKKILGLALAGASMLIASQAQAAVVVELWGTATFTKTDYQPTMSGMTTLSDLDGVFYAKFQPPSWRPYEDSSVGMLRTSVLSDTISLNTVGTTSFSPYSISASFDVGSTPLFTLGSYDLPGSGSISYFAGRAYAGYGTLLSGNITSAYMRVYDDSNYSEAIFTATAAVPEPATWALMIVGFGSIGATMRRRRPVAAFA